MKFGEALEAVKEGKLIARSGWNMLADDWMVVG